MKRANGTADFAGDLSDGAGAGKNLGNGSGTKIGTVTNLGHRNRKEKTIRRGSMTENYPDYQRLCKNEVADIQKDPAGSESIETRMSFVN